MPREDVNIKVSANVAEAIQLWRAMEAGPDGMAKALIGMGEKGREATKSLADEILGMVGKWGTVAGAVAAVTKEIRDQQEAVKRLREERLQTTNTVDDAMNRYQVQSGIPYGPQADAARNQLLAIGAQRRSDPTTTITAAEQLGSAGATHEEIVGGGLDEFLRLVNASNAAGQNVDQARLAKSLVLFLEANGKRPTGEGMRPTSTAIQQLFAGTNLQLSNLERFAPEAGTIKRYSGLSEEDQLAVFSQFLGTMDESRASTSFRSGIVRMATAGGSPEQIAALKSIGLKPEDIDFQGEDYHAAMGRLTKAFGSVAPEKANIAARQLFGQDALGFYSVLLQEGATEESRRRGQMARSSEGAEQRLATAEGSRSAAAREAESLAAMYGYDASLRDPETVRKRLHALAGQLNLSEGMVAELERTLKDDSDFFGMRTVPMDERIRRTAKEIDRWSGVPQGGLFGTPSTHMGRDDAAAILRGDKPLTIRLKTDQGRDIPVEVEATGIEGR